MPHESPSHSDDSSPESGGGPFPLKVLFGQIDKGASDIRVVGDESPIEVGEAKERAHVFDLGRGGPFGDSIKLDGVHSELPWFDDHSKVFHFVCGELALFEFEVQVKFGHVLEDTLGAFLM